MKYYIIAGEASGDLHGANLIRAILQRQPDAQIRFWGGDRMAQVAEHQNSKSQIHQVRHIRDLAYMGIVEVASHLREIVGNIRFCKRDILAFRPDVMVFIDYPGFNLKIAKFTHKHHIRNLYYISPQIWAWKKRRIRPMRRDLDKLCYILPSERKFYAQTDFPQAVYVGHPLLDEVQRYHQNENQFEIQNSLELITPACKNPKFEIQNSSPIALLPGSRKQELRRMLPLMAQLAQRHPELQFIIAGMSLIGEEFYRRYLPEGLANVQISFDGTYNLLSRARAAVVCSGTATLETALFRVPQVVCYQCNKISAAIARILIGSSIKYISLVNLIADSPIVTELIQSDFNIERLDTEFLGITTDPDVRNRILSGYDRVIDILQGPGASARTADEIIKLSNSTPASSPQKHLSLNSRKGVPPCTPKP